MSQSPSNQRLQRHLENAGPRIESPRGMKRKADESDDTAQSPNAKRFKSSFSETVTIVVGQGKNEQKFTVHEDLLRERSTFFEKALSGEWAEAKVKTTTLPDQDPALFQVFVKWVYGETYLIGLAETLARTFYNNNEPPEEALESAFSAETAKLKLINYTILFLCKIWKLGDYVGSSEFKNAVMVHLHDGIQVNASSIHVPALFTEAIVETSPQSMLQKYWLDQYAVFVNTTDLEDFWPTLKDDDFKLRLIKKLIEVRDERNGRGGTILDIHNYHERDGDDKECPMCKNTSVLCRITPLTSDNYDDGYDDGYDNGYGEGRRALLRDSY